LQPVQPLQPLQPLQVEPLQPLQPVHPLQPDTVGAEVSSAYATDITGAVDKAVNNAATAIVDFFIILLP